MMSSLKSKKDREMERERERRRLGWLVKWQEIGNIFDHFLIRRSKPSSKNDFVAINKSCKKSFEEINGSQIVLAQSKRNQKTMSVTASLSLSFPRNFSLILSPLLLSPQLLSSLSPSLTLPHMPRLTASAYTSACNQER